MTGYPLGLKIDMVTRVVTARFSDTSTESRGGGRDDGFVGTVEQLIVLTRTMALPENGNDQEDYLGDRTMNKGNLSCAIAGHPSMIQKYKKSAVEE